MALPYALVLIGAASNQAVLIANNGKFPVMENSLKDVNAEGMLDTYHCIMTKSTRLNYLADVFKFGPETDSIGDLSIDLGGHIAPYTLGAWLMVVYQRLRRALYEPSRA